jgi:hypothetical protein
MKCPNCSNETSDAASVCQWCGSLLHRQAQAPVPSGQVLSQGYPPQVPPPRGYPPQVPPPRGGVPAQPPGGYAPGDASYSGYRPQPAPPQANKPPSDPSPWYYSPWPYVVALVLVLAIIGGVLVTQKSSNSSPSGNTYADFVVGGKPTLVDFYTDT